MNILFGYFNTKVDKEDISKRTVRNESLHQISNDSGVRVINFATSKNFSQKCNVPTLQTNKDRQTGEYFNVSTIVI
jgi:hypothetical protein